MKENIIDADDSDFNYYGRMDFSNKKAVLMVNPGTYIKARFEGKSLKVRFSQGSEQPNYIGYIIDNKLEGKFKLKQNTKDEVYDLVNELDDRIHDLILIKRNDHVRGNCSFHGVILSQEKKLCKSPQPSGRKIECFGDSIAGGALSEAYGFEGKPDFEHDGEYCNGWYSFGNILSRMMGAEINNNGQGGLALADGYGYFCMPFMPGLETIYEKLNPLPFTRGGMTNWDFKQYIPHIVIIAIGQNDSSTFPQVLFEDTLKNRWKRKYKAVVYSLREHYPNAYFILSTTIMEHDTRWDDLLFEIAKEMKDKKILAYRYSRAGTGTPGHLRKKEGEEMAIELKSFIETFDDPWQGK